MSRADTYLDCPVCRGKGEMRHGAICPLCLGSGKNVKTVDYQAKLAAVRERNRINREQN
jgi:DnaJ-class molecular chaperone